MYSFGGKEAGKGPRQYFLSVCNAGWPCTHSNLPASASKCWYSSMCHHIQLVGISSDIQFSFFPFFFLKKKQLCWGMKQFDLRISSCQVHPCCSSCLKQKGSSGTQPAMLPLCQHWPIQTVHRQLEKAPKDCS